MKADNFSHGNWLQFRLTYAVTGVAHRGTDFETDQVRGSIPTRPSRRSGPAFYRRAESGLSSVTGTGAFTTQVTKFTAEFTSEVALRAYMFALRFTQSFQGGLTLFFGGILQAREGGLTGFQESRTLSAESVDEASHISGQLDATGKPNLIVRRRLAFRTSRTFLGKCCSGGYGYGQEGHFEEGVFHNIFLSG